MTEKSKIDYISIATPLVDRGFRVTPVHPETKQPVMKNWPKHQATNAAEVTQHANYYPNHNVGIVGARQKTLLATPRWFTLGEYSGHFS